MKYLSLLLLFWPLLCAGQCDSIRMAAVARKLEALTERDSTFARSVDVTAGRLPLSELLRNIARASGVNLSVRSVENVPVSCNFTRARVDELVRFLCREYTLDVETTGNILSVFPAVSVPAPRPEPEIFYNAADTTLFYDLRGERLSDVAKKITIFSGRNIVVPEPLFDYKISGYVRAMPLDGALQTLASVNGLTAEKDAQEVWTFYRAQAAPQEFLAAVNAGKRAEF